MATRKQSSANTGKRSSRTGTTPFDERWDWITIDDFTPGIYSKQQAGAATPGGALPAPHGSCQATGTFGCIAISSGALVPLPGINGQFDLPQPDAQANLVFGYFNISGFFAFGPIGPPATGASGIPDAIFVGQEWLKTDNTRDIWYSVVKMDQAGQPNEQLAQIVSAVAPTAEQYHGMTFTASRINPVAPYLTPGTPVVVAAWEPPSFSADKHIWVFPDPSNPATNTVVDLYTAAGLGAISGDILGHQSRIVILEDVTFPFGGDSGDRIPTNEDVSFTDPPNSNIFGSGAVAYQREVFVSEYPNGYGAWGSMSAGELFLVKQQGGGLIVSGDLNSPSVTRLPGVVSTAGMECRAAEMPDGLVYYSRFKGAWIWNGANNSTKLSDQLEDTFIFYPNGPGNMVNIAVQFEEWGDWILTTNGYLYDTETKGWWILDSFNNNGYIPQWFAKSYFGENMYVVPMRVTQAQCIGGIRRYTRGVATNVYNWEGQPLQASLDRVIDIREVVIVAQGANCQINIVLTALDGTTQTIVFTVNNAAQPVRLRQTAAVKGYNVVPEIFAFSTVGGPAPIVYSISFGCREAPLAVGQ
jgi:hypothetical protein